MFYPGGPINKENLTLMSKTSTEDIKVFPGVNHKMRKFSLIVLSLAASFASAGYTGGNLVVRLVGDGDAAGA